MAKGLPMNTFFDINKLPAEKGLLLFGLSMNKLFHRQNPENCLKDVRYFTPSKISKPCVGTNFIYTDYLYLYSDESASKLKQTFMNSVIDHRNGLQKIIDKNFIEFQIQQAFHYMVWNQLYVGTKDFNHLFEKLKKIYKQDSLFQKYLVEDCAVFEKEVSENQINYFLEEALMIYLLNRNQIKLPNDYIENNQKWILFCYPGKPIKTIVYLHQLNPFKIEWEESPYQNSFYDLEAKQLIDFTRVDLETYQVK